MRCGATLCRAELTHADKDHLDHFVTALSGNVRRAFQLFYEREGDALAATVYIARDGQPIPSFASELRAERSRRAPPATDAR